MRKYMNIINRLLFGAVALAALSCTGNFETYNRNPDQPSTIDRDVWDYIKSMQYNVIPTVKNQYQIVENVSGGAYGRYFAYAKSTDAGWNTGMFAFYRIANDWANPPYEVPMTNIYSNWRAIKAELEANFRIGANKAFAITRPISHARYILVTRLDRQLAKDMLFTGAVDTVEEALEIAKQFVGEKPSIILMPEGSLTVPRVE